MMDYEYECVMCDVVGDKVITMEFGIKANGDPIHRVTVFSGKKRVEATYRKMGAAYATYQLLLRVCAMD